MLEPFPGALLGGIAHGADLASGAELTAVAVATSSVSPVVEFCPTTRFVAGELHGHRFVRPDALDGRPGHADLAEEFALDGELAAVLLDDAAGQGVAVFEYDLVGWSESEGQRGVSKRRKAQRAVYTSLREKCRSS